MAISKRLVTILLFLISLGFVLKAIGFSSGEGETISLSESVFSLQDTVWKRACPPVGSAKTDRIRELNKLKNRIRFPQPSDFDSSITLDRILQPGNDIVRWNTNKAARITGYVIDVKPGGKETCNCGAQEMDERDTHIDIVADPMNVAKSLHFVAEVTPPVRTALKSIGVNWSTRALRDQFLGRWVTIEGWMFLDEEHINMSQNTRPERENNWRATAWEIHPITSIKVVQRPR